MAGKVSIPLTVEIAFNAGPMDPDPLTWTDVSAYVLRSRTISLSRGRDPQTGEPDSGPGAIRFKNPDGRFTLGKTGAFGLVRNRLPIRVRRGALVLWTGLVEKWGQATDAGVRSTVDATLVNRWPRMKVRSLTGDRLLQVCQTLDPDYLWPLTDPPGSTRAEDLIGGVDMLAVTGVTYSPWLWGAGSNPQAAALPDVVQAASSGGSQMLTAEARDGGDEVTVSLWVRVGTGEVRASLISVSMGTTLTVSPGAMRLERDTGGGTVMSYLGVSGAAEPLSPGWHHLCGTLSITGGIPSGSLYIDGAVTDSGTGMTVTWPPSRLASLEASTSTAAAYLAVFDRTLTSTEVAAIHAAGRDALGATGDTADTRAAAVAAMWSPTTVDIAGTYAPTMSKQAVEGVSQADLLLACAQAEDGLLYISRGGWPVLRPRGHRTEAALAATIPASVISHDVTWELDDQAVVNVAQVDRMALGEVASTVNRRNEASIGTYGEVSRSLQLWLDTDAAAVERANGEVTMWADAAPRTRAFTVDLMACAAAIPADTLLAVDIGSRIQVSGLSSVYPGGTSAGYYVDAIADEITEKSWRRTFTVTPALDFLVLDDATFGGLDEWPLG